MALEDSEKNWRVWIFVGDYLESAGTAAEVATHYEDYIGRYFESDTLKAVLPADSPDERMFAKYAQYLRKLGQSTKSARIAKLATDNIRRAPQSAGQLSELYLEDGQFDDAIAMASRALVDDRRDQTHVNNSAMLMNIALSKDSLLMRDPPPTLENYREKMKEVLTSYAAVLRSQRVIGAYYLSIPDQINALIADAESRGVTRGQIIEALPPEISAIYELKRTSERGGGLDQQSAILRAKQISGLPRHEWADNTARLANEIKASDQRDAIATVLRSAAEHFKNDSEEFDFVEVMLEILRKI